MIGALIAKLQELGPLRLLQAAMITVFNFILQKIYRFDPWHISGNYYNRPYKARVIALAEKHKPNLVVEIGAGLGDVIGRVRAPYRIGFDLDPNVLKAARFCVPRDVKLADANFLDAESVIAALHKLHVNEIDCLILVNWIHNLEIDEIIGVVSRIATQIPIHYVLVDAIRSGTKGYRHHHHRDAFRRLGATDEIVTGDAVRDLILIRR